jgi:hypothetical protein
MSLDSKAQALSQQAAGKPRDLSVVLAQVLPTEGWEAWGQSSVPSVLCFLTPASFQHFLPNYLYP